ncbi:MAG: MATE family efflux transporter [Lachnospiraceae bacterium]|jgi:putative MATE family efflux protein|nr:MATE family efflux transporter [Lachnospiraceae bacterium]
MQPDPTKQPIPRHPEPEPTKQALAAAQPESEPAKQAHATQPAPEPAKQAPATQPAPEPAKQAPATQPAPGPAKQAPAAQHESEPAKQAHATQPAPEPAKQAPAPQTKLERMLTRPVELLVLQMAVPTIVIMLITALYNMADTYFVSFLGTSATAGVGIIFSLMAIIQAIGFLFGQGAGNVISRALGAKDSRQASEMATTATITAFFFGLALMAFGLVFLTPLNYFLGATDTILPHSKSYMRLILIGCPFMVTSLALNNLLRFQGSANHGMVGMVSGAVLNIFLDPLLIFVFHMGVAGAALATIVSQAISCAILFVMCQRGENVRISLSHFAPSFHTYYEILRNGAPSLLRQLLASVATIVLNQAARPYGDAAIAAISIVNRVVMMAASALLGFGQGFQPVCGFNYGAGRYDRVKRAFYFCVRYSSLFLLIVAVLGYANARAVIELFRKDDPDVVRIGTVSLRLVCLSQPLMGWVILNNMLLQTTGRALPASILATVRQGVFLIPILLIFSARFGLLGIQMSTPIADALTFALSLPMGIKALREMRMPAG